MSNVPDCLIPPIPVINAIETQPLTETQRWDTGHTQEYSSNSLPNPFGKLTSYRITCKTLGGRGQKYIKGTQYKETEIRPIAEFIVGTKVECGFQLTDEQFNTKMIQQLSCQHFKILKAEKNDECPVFIHDLSEKRSLMVNNERLYNRKRILLDGDRIHLLPRTPEAFIYHSFNKDQSKYPKEMASEFFVSSILGEGACGIVRKIIDVKKCVPYAVKTLTVEAELKNKERKNDQMLNEKEIMLKMNHPNILGIIHAYSLDEKEFLVVEYMAGGDLLMRMNRAKGISEKYSKLYFYQLAQGVKYLHQRGVIHRDLKPNNALCKTNDNETLIKVTDFGLSKFNDQSQLHSTVGTLEFIANEVQAGNYTKQADIWSLGVTLYVMLLMMSPKKNTVDCKLPRKYRSVYSDECNDIINKMLRHVPKNRIKIDDLVNHAWFDDEAMLQKYDRLINGGPIDNLDDSNVENTVNSSSTSSGPKKKLRKLN